MKKLLSKTQKLIPSGKKGFFLYYTLIFLFATAIIYLPFLLDSKSFVWIGTTDAQDGYNQHYMAFTYFGQWCREIITTLFTQGRLEIPMWDFTIGYGSDVLASMHYYAFGDPLDLISILVPSEFSEFAYCFLILLRLYLSGISFSLFAFKMNNRRCAILAGSIAYVFCGYTFYAAVRHPFFMNPMIYLPLIILGAEKILRKERPLLFIFMIFITTISNFYFLYMSAVAVVLYVIIRYFTMERLKSIKDFSITILKFSLSGLLGIGMACVIFLPVVNQLLTSNRLVQSSVAPELFYSFTYYEKFITTMFSSVYPSDWTCLGFSAPIFVALILMFMCRKKHTGLKIGWVVIMLMLSFPIVGKIMNGLSYVSNRWSFVLAGVMAYILVALWEDLLNITKRQLIACFSLSAVYLLLLLYFKESAGKIGLLAFCIILATLIIITIYRKKSFISLSKRAVSIILMLMVTLSCIITGINKNREYTDEFLNSGTALYNIQNSTNSALASAMKNETTFVRSDSDKNSDPNSSVITGNYGTQFYWSIESGAVSTFLTENALNNFYAQKYDGLNNRTFLSALASVKYFSEAENTGAPYGYGKIKTVEADGDTFNIYKNSNPLPLGYTYSEYITDEDYQKMDSAQKQQAMLQGVVLKDTEKLDLSSYNSATPEYSHIIKNSEIQLGENIVIQKDGSFLVNEPDSEITLTFEGVNNCETYLHIKGIEADTMNEYELYTDDCQEYYSTEEFLSLSTAQQNELKKADFIDAETALDLELKFQVQAKGEASHIMNYCHKSYRYSTGQEDYLVNLGYSEEAKNEISFRFPNSGVFRFDTMEIICQPMDDFNSYVDTLKQDILVKEKITSNSVSGEITLNEDKILVLSIPYSHGWSATVNGKEVELLQANSMYMAIPLTAGTHNIQLNYKTPLLNLGVSISIISFGIFIGMAIAYRKKKHIKK